MKQHIGVVQTIPDFQSELEVLAGRLQEGQPEIPSAILVQLFFSSDNLEWINQVTDAVLTVMPEAIVVGATTDGEIANGKTLTNSTVFSISVFAKTTLRVVADTCLPGEELALGEGLRDQLLKQEQQIAGVLFLATPLSINVSSLLDGLASGGINFPLFGGGAGDYAVMEHSLVIANRQTIDCGAVVVALISDDLVIKEYTYSGWMPLTREMTITATKNDRIATEIDGRPAYDVYSGYLGIENDQQFFLNSLEFPFLVKRDNELLGRTPMKATEDGGIHFIADVKPGDKFRIGYGDPKEIIAHAKHARDELGKFCPEAIFLYTCCCRRFLMQNDVEMETLPFEEVAPTAGFYTYGEFLGKGSHISHYNSTMLVVGMREGEPKQPMDCDVVSWAPEADLADKPDLYKNQHIRVVTQLIHFIETITAELEDRNRELMQLAVTDKLTGLFNRAKLDQVLDEEIVRHNRYGTEFCVIMADIDDFKMINDTFGHHKGDAALMAFSDILRQSIRANDTAGRWGGEEFLIVLPHTSVDAAAQTAEKIRALVASGDYGEVKTVTASFGVLAHKSGETVDDLLLRADMALYAAKRKGRNAVVCQ